MPDGADISLPVVARLLATTRAEADHLVDRLVNAHLLDTPSPGRYRMHDLVRLYAREHEVSESVRWAALARTWRCYIATVATANQLIRPGFRTDLVKTEPSESLPVRSRAQAMAWLERERANIVAAAEQAASAPAEHARASVHIAHVMFDSLHTNRHWTDLRALNGRALDVARTHGDQYGEGQVLTDLGVTAWLSGQGGQAIDRFTESLRLRREIGDLPGEAMSLHNLATAYSERGRFDAASECAEHALRIRRSLGDLSGQGRTLGTLAQIHRNLGQLDAAIPRLRESLRIVRELGDQRTEALSLDDLGSTLVETGDLDEAVDCYQRALAINRDLGALLGTTWNLVGLGEAFRRSSSPREAADACAEALEISRDIGAQHECGRALWRLGCALADLGEQQRARECWREALAVLEPLGVHEAAAVRRLLLQ